MYLYHICREQDKGDTSKGYIGVSKDLKTRWKSHKKGGGNKHLTRALKKYADVVFYVICKTTEEFALYLEKKLRPSIKMGWNLAIGGGLPPNFKGIKRPSSFGAKISERQRGSGNPAFGKPAHNKGVMVNSVDYYERTSTRRDAFKKYCNKHSLEFTSFVETFSEWLLKPSGIRYRTYTYKEIK